LRVRVRLLARTRALRARTVKAARACGGTNLPTGAHARCAGVCVLAAAAACVRKQLSSFSEMS
jgi:hypothetical protein